MSAIVDLLIQDGVVLKRSGGQLVALCPFHKEKTPSFTVNPKKGKFGVYHCFGCGVAGDAVDYLTDRRRMTKKEALESLQGPLGTGSTGRKASGKQRVKHKTDVETNQPKFVIDLPKNAVLKHAYRNADGKLRFVICRIPPPANSSRSKGYLPFARARKGGELGWLVHQPMPRFRPLYRLPELSKSKPEQQVMVVEGEKCADAVAEVFPTAVVTTWAHGSKSVKKTDWRPLYGRRVLLVADAGDVGHETMRVVADLLAKNETKDIRIVLPPEEDGWDIADEIDAGGAKRAAKWLSNLAVGYTEGIQAEPEPMEPVPEDIDQNRYFHILGNADELIVVKLASDQVMRVPRTAITLPRHLLAIAPDIQWWLSTLQADAFSQPVAQHVGTALIKAADRRGQLDMNRIVGRGARITDSGQIVWHLGDRLMVNGKEVRIKDYKDPDDRNIYVSGTGVVAGPDVIGQRERADIAAMLMRYRWDTPEDGKRMLGWLVTSMVGGALEWRPHLWFYGESDQGKSWFIKNVIMRVLDSVAVHLSNPTAASIARRVRSDSLPLVLDEAEPDQDWITSTIPLVRIAAGGDGERTRADGGSSGSITSYAPRFSACMSSTKLPRLADADNNRIVLAQLSADGIDDWPSLKVDILDVLAAPSQNGRDLRSTIIRDTAQIAGTARRLADGLIEDGVSARSAMLQGALSAGWQWWSGGDELVEVQHPAPIASDSEDAARALQEILHTHVRTREGDKSLLGLLAENASPEIAASYGIAKKADGLYLAPTHPELKRAIASSSFARVDVMRLLRQIKGARFTDNPRRFGRFYRARAVILPYDACHALGLDLTWLGAVQDDDRGGDPNLFEE